MIILLPNLYLHLFYLPFLSTFNNKPIDAHEHEAKIGVDHDKMRIMLSKVLLCPEVHSRKLIFT